MPRFTLMRAILKRKLAQPSCAAWAAIWKSMIGPPTVLKLISPWTMRAMPSEVRRTTSARWPRAFEKASPTPTESRTSSATSAFDSTSPRWSGKKPSEIRLRVSRVISSTYSWSAGMSSVARPSARTSFTGVPERKSGESWFSSRKERTGLPFTDAMASPRLSPAVAAGLPGVTSAMKVETVGSAAAKAGRPPAQVETGPSRSGS